jgi:hypothetical protein
MKKIILSAAFILSTAFSAIASEETIYDKVNQAWSNLEYAYGEAYADYLVYDVLASGASNAQHRLYQYKNFKFTWNGSQYVPSPESGDYTYNEVMDIIGEAAKTYLTYDSKYRYQCNSTGDCRIRIETISTGEALTDWFYARTVGEILVGLAGESFEEGFRVGFENGYDVGFQEGYAEGFIDGYLTGYVDGTNDCIEYQDCY